MPQYHIDEKQLQPSGHIDLHKFGTDILVYCWGNALLLLFGFILFLIIPKYLSVEDFGYFQLFMLYASYVGILHLGFILTRSRSASDEAIYSKRIDLLRSQ